MFVFLLAPDANVCPPIPNDLRAELLELWATVLTAAPAFKGLFADAGECCDLFGRQQLFRMQLRKVGQVSQLRQMGQVRQGDCVNHVDTSASKGFGFQIPAVTGSSQIVACDCVRTFLARPRYLFDQHLVRVLLQSALRGTVTKPSKQRPIITSEYLSLSPRRKCDDIGSRLLRLGDLAGIGDESGN